MTAETQYAFPKESIRLIEEIQQLIQMKGMKAEMDIIATNAEVGDCAVCAKQVVGGCTGCALCACMICV